MKTNALICTCANGHICLFCAILVVACLVGASLAAWYLIAKRRKDRQQRRP